MQRNQQHIQKCDSSELSLHLQKQNLLISLKGGAKSFQSSFNNFNLPTDIESNFGNIETLFQILKSKENYDLDAEKGILSLKLTIQLNKKKIEKVISLRLQESISESQREVADLRRKITESQERFQKLQKETKELRKMVQRHNIQLSYIEKQQQKYQMEKEQQKKEKNEIGGKVEVMEQKFTGFLENFEEKTKKEEAFEKNTRFSSEFSIEGNRAQYVGKGQSTQLRVNKILSKTTIEQIQFRIVRTKQRFIYIGVIDKTKHKNTKDPWDKMDSVGIWGDDGRVFDLDAEFVSGTGFTQNQTITMIVNLREASIRWLVDGKQIASVVSNYIRRSSKGQFVPYIQLETVGDAVELIV